MPIGATSRFQNLADIYERTKNHDDHHNQVYCQRLAFSKDCKSDLCRISHRMPYVCKGGEIEIQPPKLLALGHIVTVLVGKELSEGLLTQPSGQRFGIRETQQQRNIYLLVAFEYE